MDKTHNTVKNDQYGSEKYLECKIEMTPLWFDLEHLIKLKNIPRISPDFEWQKVELL